MEGMTLKDWTIHFVKNKDVFQKKLQSYEENGLVITFLFSDKKHDYFISEVLDAQVMSFVKETGLKSVVCLGVKDNLKFLIDNWNALKLIYDLNFIFVDTQKNTRWIISPIIHSKICDEESLILGLESMFSNVFP